MMVLQVHLNVLLLCVSGTGEVTLHEEAMFKAAGRSVYGLYMMRSGLLAACGGGFSTYWAAMYNVSGQQQARLQLPEGCKPRGMMELGSHLLLTDNNNKCLQVWQPLQEAQSENK